MAQTVQKWNSINCSCIFILCDVTVHINKWNSCGTWLWRDTDSKPVKDGTCLAIQQHHSAYIWDVTKVLLFWYFRAVHKKKSHVVILWHVLLHPSFCLFFACLFHLNWPMRVASCYRPYGLSSELSPVQHEIHPGVQNSGTFLTRWELVAFQERFYSLG